MNVLGKLVLISNEAGRRRGLIAAVAIPWGLRKAFLHHSRMGEFLKLIYQKWMNRREQKLSR